MDLETIALGITGTLAIYATVDYERRMRIDKLTDHLITDSCYRRTDNRDLNLPSKQKFMVTGFDTYRAVQRYNQVYDALQEKGDTADFKELLKLWDVK